MGGEFVSLWGRRGGGQCGEAQTPKPCSCLPHPVPQKGKLRAGQAWGALSLVPSSPPPLGCRSDCLIKTVRSEGYFGMYRGEAGGGAGVGRGARLEELGGRWQHQAGRLGQVCGCGRDPRGSGCWANDTGWDPWGGQSSVASPPPPLPASMAGHGVSTMVAAAFSLVFWAGGAPSVPGDGRGWGCCCKAD